MMKIKKTLILSKYTEDAHVQRLVTEFDRLGHPWVVFDPGDFPSQVQSSAAISNGTKHSFLSLANGTTVCLEEFTSVWYRRPTPITPPAQLPEMERTFIEREANAGYGDGCEGYRPFG